MKFFKILAIVALLVVTSWGQEAKPQKTRPPYEHRGFFFSAGTGVAYTNLKAYQEDSDGSWEENTSREFSGWSAPLFDFKFGKSIANLIVLHSRFELATYSGETDYHYTEKSYSEGINLFGISLPKYNTDEKKSLDSYAFSFSLGLGFMVYPFRNPRSVMNGFYVGFSSGMDAFFAVSGDDDGDIDVASAFTQYEVGKDWWVSETWSLGVAFAFSLHDFVEDGAANDGGVRGTFKFLIRLTRG